MNENIINIFGHIGSCLVSINLIPQIVKIIKKKSGNNISYLTIILNILASIFMLLYGYYKFLYPVIISNSVILMSSLTILYFKKYYNTENNNDYVEQIEIQIQ